MLKNFHVQEDDLVKLKGYNQKGDIICMLSDEKSIYINWDCDKTNTIENMKDVFWIKNK